MEHVHTSAVNAHSLTKGDVIVDGGKQYRLITHPCVRDGAVYLRVANADGAEQDLAWPVNQPVARVVGARSAGVGGL